MINARPRYVIEKMPQSWRLMHVPASKTCGVILGHYKSRKAATTTARLLAGRTADVMYFEACKAEHYKGETK